MTRCISIIIIFLISFSFTSFAQKDNKFSFDVYGILDMQGFYNDRKTYSAIDGLFSLYPLSPSYDANQNDLNSKDNSNFSVAASRLGVRLGLGEALGAKILGTIEADFTGQADGIANYFKLRIANINLKWDNTQLLVGQYWNPMVIAEMLPSNRDLHNGAPFHPFARQSQIRVDFQPLENLNLVAALGFQRDFATIGVSSSKDYKQQTNTLIPEFNIFIQYRSNNLFFGIGGKIMTIEPRENYTFNTTTYGVDQRMTNYLTTFFLNYKKDNSNLKLQALMGENMNDLSLLGGYYESSFDTITHSFSYKPTTVFSSWIDFSQLFGKIKPALLIGYSKNFDVNESSYANAYGLGMTIDNYFRIAPRIEYFFLNNFSLTLSLEYASVKYKDEVSTKRIDGKKASFALCYLFNY
ncbi:MAG: hypothetical protein WC108_06720 [Bacteroidales bacterium]|nr:hypothetical protein [Bacteroidales bacterium]MDD4529248.1 hypothetical protein [Bacteroidales bacterium]MDD4829900.1 hypothetical protein [Bacteroidales bacterium]